jgi:HTH-type transcriptional regulator, glycine betaine synthesis regulator
MMDSKIYRHRREGPEHLTLQAQMDEISKDFINNLGRVADFFGFNRLMGQLYAVLFLSPEPLTLDDMVKKLESSKGNVSINIRALERWGLVRQIYKWADRKNYYEAEPDIWKAVSGILQERERKESQQIISSLNQSLEMLEQASKTASGQEALTAQFYLERMEALRRLFKFGDSLLDMMVQGGAVDFGSASRLARATDDYQEAISDLDELERQQSEPSQEGHGARK